MAFLVIGTNHNYSSIGLRERLSFSKKSLEGAFSFLKETKALKEWVILSTCNRVEIYASTDMPDSEISSILDFISMYHEIDKKELLPYLYIYKERDAVRHLFRVAAGLDSLILGELQILGQVKASFYESEKVGFVEDLLREVFYSAASTAKRIHTETNVSRGKVSIGSVAIDFIKEKIGDLVGKTILVIGVGKVTELVLKYLKKEGRGVVFISNRTFEKARDLACKIGARAVRFDNLRESLQKADIVITATRSPHFIIKKETLGPRELLIVDLALPRDVDPRVREIGGVELFGLEDLGAVIQKNRDRRKIEAEKAEGIIQEEVERLWQKLSGLEQERVCLR